MTKREKKRRDELRRHERNGRCHICTRWRILEDEHFPPQSAGNSKPIWVHTLNGLKIGANQQKIAPPMRYRNGLKRRSVCRKCNHDTQLHYNVAFKDWTEQARAALPATTEPVSIEVAFKQIEPLAILKQILTGALAACDFSSTPEADTMRRFVLDPTKTGLPSTLRVLSYLNPPRSGEEDDIALTTKRVCWHFTQLDTKRGVTMFTIAEYATCPLGYVTLSMVPPFGICEEALELADITSFCSYGPGEKVDLRLSLPVRNPFGPVSCHFANIKGEGEWYLSDADVKAGKPIPRAKRA